MNEQKTFGNFYHNCSTIPHSTVGDETLKSPLLIHPAPPQYWQDGKRSYWLYFEGTDHALPQTFSYSEASKIRNTCIGTREAAMTFLDSQDLLNNGLIKIRFELAEGGEVA